MIRTALIYFISDICLDKIFTPILKSLAPVKESNLFPDGHVLEWVEFIRGNTYCRLAGGVRVEDGGNGIVIFRRMSEKTVLWLRDWDEDEDVPGSWRREESIGESGWAARWKDIMIWDLGFG